MNMAMRDYPGLPTPYPVGVNGMGGVLDFVNAPFDWAASLFVSQPDVIPITPQAKSAIAQGFAKNQTAISSKAPGVAASIQSAIQSGNWESAARNLSVGSSIVGGGYDKALERDRMKMSFVPEAANRASQWIIGNWQWLALLGGGVLVVKYLTKRN